MREPQVGVRHCLCLRNGSTSTLQTADAAGDNERSRRFNRKMVRLTEGLTSLRIVSVGWLSIGATNIGTTAIPSFASSAGSACVPASAPRTGPRPVEVNEK
jgi:hypothetical protein